MYQDISSTEGISEWQKSLVAVAARQTVDIDDVAAPVGYATAIAWDFIVSDSFGGVMRAGTVRTVVSNGNKLLEEIPFSVAEAIPEGYGARLISLKAVRTADEVISLRVVNGFEMDVTVSFAAKKFLVPLEPEVPKIQLTISGLVGDATFNGMGNGVHLLRPEYHNYMKDVSVDYTDASWSSGHVSTSTEKELWRFGYIVRNNGVENQGALVFAAGQTATSATSFNWIRWVRDTYTAMGYATYSSSSTPTDYGGLRDNVLSDSWTHDGVTFQWQRAPGQTGAWGNY